MSTVKRVSALELRELTKYYGDDLGTHGVSFTVANGETFGFLGPNGAGKTTTMRLLLGLIKPTRGSTSILGKNIAEGLPVRERVGYLPGALESYENLTDLLLTLPLSRTKIILANIFASLAVILALATLLTITLIVGVNLVGQVAPTSGPAGTWQRAIT